MRPAGLAEALLALGVMGLIGMHSCVGGPSYTDPKGVVVVASPNTAALHTATADQDPSLRHGCSRSPVNPASSSHPVQPLASAHAHDDYAHCRPLYDALRRGFTSIEADVWLVDGRLLVAHDRDDVRADTSLEQLYLSPLEKRIRTHAGVVYSGWEGSFELLIDVKSEAAHTYAALEDLLRRHHRIMTAFTDHRIQPRAVTAIISGNRDRGAMRSRATRYAGFDGRLGDLSTRFPRSFMPTVAADWQETFTWDGLADMPAAEERRLRRFVTEAHAHGRRVRFWGTPDAPGPARDAVWNILLEAHVDQISTDDVAGLATYLSN